MKTPKPILDRRRSIRVDEKLPFKIGHEAFEAEAHTLNISAHGALCLVEKDIPIMTQIRVSLALPGKGKSKGKTIRLKAAVVRKERQSKDGPFLVALYFSDISTADREYLQKYIESRLVSN